MSENYTYEDSADLSSEKSYTYDDVYNASLDYFSGDEFAANVFASKYALNDGNDKYYELTPRDMHKRLAREFARIESKYPNPLTEEEIFDLLDGFKYIVPQGSPMSAIGNKFQLQTLGNCYVLEPPFDSYGGILKADQELAQLMKRRAGVGLSLDNIRPKGISTNNAAKTTDGIGVFMERFSNTCREVAQSGRRGAELQMLSVHHPEIETFINMKRNKTKVTGANISVKLTDEFMIAVKNDEEYEQRWPVDSDNPKITKKIKAKYIWDQIVDAAWSSAEPGLFFIDNQTKYSPADIYGKINKDWISTATNPCQPGWATILTPNGITTIDKIKIGDLIWSGQQWTKVINKICTGVKPVYAYRTTAGTFYGTENHRIVSNGEKIEVVNASSIDINQCNDVNVEKSTSIKDDELLAIVDGLIIGDGMTHKASNDLITLCIGQDDSDYFKSEIKDYIIEHRPGIGPVNWLVKTSIKQLPKTYERAIPDKYKFGEPNLVSSFLRGLYSANGSIAGGRITLKTSSFTVVEDVQQMLSSLGIASYHTTNKPHEVEFENGIYECKQSYDISIGTKESRKRFIELIGFIQKYKQEKANKTCECKPSCKKPKSTFDIKEKEYIDDEKVYDLTVQADEHTYWSGGLLVSNCGEIGMGVDSCRLLLINLFSFVEHQFTNDAYFNYDKFADIIIKAQRLMDDIVDLELECMDKIIEKIEEDPEPEEVKAIELNLWKRLKKNCIDGRRTGLGITGLGDALAALNIRYGSEISIKTTENIYKALAVNAYKSTCIMAKERGAFPIFSHEIENNHPFLQRIWDAAPDVYELYKQYGRRNIALTTTAPAGSVSTLTQTTSGIEPAFLVKYDRYRKVNPDDPNVIIDRVDDVGDSWQKYTIYHHGFKKWSEITGETKIEDSPYYKATSNDVDWVAGVKIQSKAQFWVCHSLSRTANIPKESPKTLVSDIYLAAWESGCKGYTVYRDGCRDGVLVSSENKSNQKVSIKNQAPKRPKTLNSETHKIRVDFGDGDPRNAYVTVSFFPDTKRPYEIFVVSPYQGLDEKDLQILELTTRTTSMNLRHGLPIKYICEQLDKIGGQYIFSIPMNIAKLLRQYESSEKSENTNEQHEENSFSKCPSCNKRTYALMEGCGICTDPECSYSGCS